MGSYNLGSRQMYSPNMPSKEAERLGSNIFLGILGGFALFLVLGTAGSDYINKLDRKNWPDAPKAYVSGDVRTYQHGNNQILAVYSKEAQKPIVYVCGPKTENCISEADYLAGVAEKDRRAEIEKIDKKVYTFYANGK